MSNTKVTTGEVRFSFPHVFQPHANNPGQEEKYSVTILIPKTDTVTINAIPTAMFRSIPSGMITPAPRSIRPTSTSGTNSGP